VSRLLIIISVTLFGALLGVLVPHRSAGGDDPDLRPGADGGKEREQVAEANAARGFAAST
jgi:hypothetical protein